MCACACVFYTVMYSLMLLFFRLFACVHKTSLADKNLGQPEPRKASVREVKMQLPTRECFCCLGANDFACLKNAHSHIKPWPTLPELAERFYCGPGSIFCSPQRPVGKDFAHTRRFSLSGPVARSFLGTPSKTSPRRLLCLQNAHLCSLHTYVSWQGRDFL